MEKILITGAASKNCCSRHFGRHMRKLKRILHSFFILSVVTSCSGSGGSGTDAESVFVTVPTISGLQYRSIQTGETITTDNSGQIRVLDDTEYLFAGEYYRHRPSPCCSFSLANIIQSFWYSEDTFSNELLNRKVTIPNEPVILGNGQINSSETSEIEIPAWTVTFVNMARVMMAIDTDNNAANGIDLPTSNGMIIRRETFVQNFYDFQRNQEVIDYVASYGKSLPDLRTTLLTLEQWHGKYLTPGLSFTPAADAGDYLVSSYSLNYGLASIRLTDLDINLFGVGLQDSVRSPDRFAVFCEVEGESTSVTWNPDAFPGETVDIYSLLGDPIPLWDIAFPGDLNLSYGDQLVTGVLPDFGERVSSRNFYLRALSVQNDGSHEFYVRDIAGTGNAMLILVMSSTNSSAFGTTNGTFTNDRLDPSCD